MHLGKDFVKKADDVELVAKTIQYLKRDRAINFDKNSLEKYAKIVFEDEKSKALFKEKLKSLNVDLLKKENLVKLCETQEEFNKKLDLISDIIDKRISKYKTTKDKAFSYNCILEIMNYIGDRQSLSKDLNIKNHNIDDNVIALSFIVRDFCKNNKGFISQKSENMLPLLKIIKKYNENDYGVKITVDNNKDEKGLLLHHINEELNKIFKPHQAEKSIDVTGCDINIAFERDEKGFIKFRQQYIIKNEDFSLAYGSEAKTELPLGLLINYNQKDKSIKNIIISGELFGHIEELKSTGSVFDDDSNDKNQIKQQGFKFNPSSSNIQPHAMNKQPHAMNKDMIKVIQTIRNEIGSKNLGSYEEDTQPTAIKAEANAILDLFKKVLDDEENKFTEDNKKLIENFFQGNPVGNNQITDNAVENKQVRHKKKIFDEAPSNNSEQESHNGSTASSNKVSSTDSEDEKKRKIIKTALLQRNKYDAGGSKNTYENRAKGTSYEELKTTLQTLNKENINFTTESLKLFNDGDKTLGTRKEVDNLIEKKPLFVRAMGKADINEFKSITKASLVVNEPSNNILLAKPELVASQSIRVGLMQLQYKINNPQQ